MLNLISDAKSLTAKLSGRYYFRWNATHLRLTQDTKSSNVSYKLVPELHSGWYMIEIKLLSRKKKRVNCQIATIDASTNVLNLLISAEKTTKRLVWMSKNTHLRLIFNEVHARDIRITEFKLVRVTKWFAYERMLTKLNSLHPKYKTVLLESKRPSTTKSFFISAKNLIKTWNDYCALFDTGKSLFTYEEWINQFDKLSIIDIHALKNQASAFLIKPKVSLSLIVDSPSIEWLDKTIQSVLYQLYDNWELCIIVRSKHNPALIELLNKYLSKDSRIKVFPLLTQTSTASTLNTVIELVSGEWFIALNQHDQLSKHALFYLVKSINENHNLKFIYSDEDQLNTAGERVFPHFKCDWNLDLFYSQNFISNLAAFQLNLIREVGGFREGFEHAEKYDLILHCLDHLQENLIHHIPRILYHTHVSNKPHLTSLTGLEALNQHFNRLNVSTVAELTNQGYRVKYALPHILPKVSLIIPSRNNEQLLHCCIESILSKTNYENYEILIIDNGSDKPSTKNYLESLKTQSIIRILRDDREFNYSALNNAAVKHASGEIIGLINDDIEVITSDWLTEMVSHALRPEVGAVGARLWYSDYTLQHAGVVLGIQGGASHAHRFLEHNSPGYFGRAELLQSFSAVTAACLIVRKSIFEQVGGLDEKLQVACNDIDLCLRIKEAGYKNIWTPYAELYHHESISRGLDDTPEKRSRAKQEYEYMRNRWHNLIFNDPAYNPNLTLDREDFSLAWPPRV